MSKAAEDKKKKTEPDAPKPDDISKDPFMDPPEYIKQMLIEQIKRRGY